MKRDKHFITKLSCILFAIACLLISFQNCARVNLAAINSEKSQMASSGGNGDGYEGKPGAYDHVIVAQPCADVGADGKSLPNNVVFMFSDGSAELVRQNCADLATPTHVDPATMQVDNSTETITISGESFGKRNLSNVDFNVTASSCPLGKAMKASPLRTNFLADSQFVGGPSWMIHPALAVNLLGSMASLPAWELIRVTSDIESTFRASQYANLVAGKAYAYTFFVKPGSLGAVSVLFTRPSLQLKVHATFEFPTQNQNVLDSTGATNVTTSSRAFAGGYIVSVYFTPTTTGQAELGFAPYSRFVASAQGESVVATAFQLEDVANYCQ